MRGNFIAGVQGGNGYVTGDKPRETVTVYEVSGGQAW